MLRYRGAAALAAGALMALALMPAAGAAAAAPSAPAVPHLDWKACGSGFFCATAAVPLDYARAAQVTRA